MPHEDQTADLRKRLGKTTAMLHQAHAQGKAITEGATARAKQVDARLQALRGKAITDQAAGDEYLDLLKERGALLRTLARS